MGQYRKISLISARWSRVQTLRNDILGHSARYSTLSLARWWERMRELTVEKKAGEKQQLTNCGDRSCGLPSNSHPLDLPLGRMSHKHAWRSGSLQHTKQCMLTPEVISLFRPTTPSCCTIPVFYKMLLAHHGAHGITESVHSFRKRQGFSSTLRENSPRAWERHWSWVPAVLSFSGETCITMCCSLY